MSSATIDLAEHVENAVESAPEHAPAVERDRLYRLWEEGHWQAKAIDFTQDRIDWQEKLTERQRRALMLYVAMFLAGEEAVTVTLAPFLNAAPNHEDRIYLATQIVDEARHHVFFDRFLREVVGMTGGMDDLLRDTAPLRTWGYEQVFGELDRVSDRIRQDPSDRTLLAQGIAIYHLVTESMLAHPGQRVLLRDFGPRHNALPGFSAGIRFLSRDESRHIAFGIGLLRRLVTEDPRCKEAAIGLFDRVLPWASGIMTPPGLDWSLLAELDVDPLELYAFALRSIETKLAAVGIEPTEILSLARLGLDTPPAKQAKRLKAFIEGGIIGPDDPAQATEATLDALFASHADVAAWSRPRWSGLRATYAWDFPDAPPRSLTLGDGDAIRVAIGPAPAADVTLQCTATDWVRMSSGKLDMRRAHSSGRLKINGDRRLALRLGTILPA